MGLFSKTQKFIVTLEVSADNSADVTKKTTALQLLANNIDTDNLEMLGTLSKKIGVNVAIRSHKENLLSL